MFLSPFSLHFTEQVASKPALSEEGKEAEETGKLSFN
jgi:hypothetical protein